MKPIMSWDELAVAVRARRRELGLTQADVAAAGHVSVELIRNIETRRRTPERLNPRKARGLEDALRWESGSIDAVLAGGVATTAEPKPPLDAEVAAPDPGDRFALARQIVALRATLSAHQRSISPDARETLMTEMANSAREAEETIVRMMPWLGDTERGEAIDLLLKLREPLS
ncbi:DNA-binding protein [Mycobacterium sp. AT1]|nr:DNA-binding protein [Mycobacterium sp. AT1]